MSDRIKEKCACGAYFELPLWPTMTTDRWDVRVELIREWRQGHRHEFPPTPAPESAGEPTPFESQGAMVEHAFPDHDWHRPTVGFSPNGI